MGNLIKTTMNTTETEVTGEGSAPRENMKAFFERQDVRNLQEIQKRNPYGSEEHIAAFEALRTLAIEIEAEQFFGRY